MISIATFREMALSFPAVVELPHFDRASFRVNKKIFATLAEKENICVLMLSVIDQSVFCDIDKTMIYPVPGGWGRQGATIFELKKVNRTILKDGLTRAYNRVAQKKKTSR